jgi:hypothetical protein
MILRRKNQIQYMEIQSVAWKNNFAICDRENHDSKFYLIFLHIKIKF